MTEPGNRAKWDLKGYNSNWSHATMNRAESLSSTYTLFKEVTNVPYHYAEESHFFNRLKYGCDAKKSFFQLRHQLTIQLIENEPWQMIEDTLRGMALRLSLPVEGIDTTLKDEIVRPLGVGNE